MLSVGREVKMEILDQLYGPGKSCGDSRKRARYSGRRLDAGAAGSSEPRGGTLEESQPNGLLTATDFEFRHRFWLIGAFFWVGFSLYAFARKRDQTKRLLN